MIKRFTPLILSLISLSIIIFFWDYIKLPYDYNNNILGEPFDRKYNPTNNTLRFILFISIPVFIYLYFYLKLNKDTLSIKINDKDFFIKKFNNKKELDPLKKYNYFLIFLIFIEFLSVDFTRFNGAMDTFHDGSFLVPPMNYLITKNILQSTFHDYGFIANNLGLIFNYFFGYYTPGSIIFIFLICIFLIKFFLILIIKKIINFSSFNSQIKIIFFLLLSLIAIKLPDYYDHIKYFNPRILLYLSFVYFLGSELCKYKKINYNFFFIGLFSLFSVLWWFDIGAYTNVIILLTILYLSLFKEFKSIAVILISIIVIWLIFLQLLSADDLKEFWLQLKLVYSKSYEYLLGLEYKKPFSDKSSRWTKALLLIYFTCLILIHFNFNKKLNLDGRIKIFLNLFFISGIFVFKSALMRSDSPHIKYSSGIYTLVFIFLFLFFIFYFLKNKTNIEIFLKSFKSKNKINTIFFIISILFFLGVFDKKNFQNNYFKNLNIFNFQSNIFNLVKEKDKLFLKDDTLLEVLKRYEELSIKDNCVQILTDDITFSYLLKKKTCTQTYIPAVIITKNMEEKFIAQLKVSNPQIILYESKNKVLFNKSNMPNAIEFVNNNYTFFENFKGYIFYEKNSSKF